MWKLLPYLKNYKKESIIGPLFKLLEACFELLVPVIMARIIDVGIRNRDLGYILGMGAVLVFLGVLGLSCSVTAQYFAAKAAAGFGTELRHDLFQHINQMSYSEIDKAGSSTLVVRMTSDINQVQTGVNQVLRLFLRSPFIVVGAMVMAFTINWRMALIFVISVPILSMVIYGIMAAAIPLYKKVQQRLDKILLLARENLAGIRVVRAFCMQEREGRQFEEESDLLMKLQLHVGRISALMNPVTYLLVNAGIIAVVWYGGLQVNTNNLTQGEVIALVSYMTQILLALVALATLIVSFTKAIASAGRINEIFDLKSSITDGNETKEAEDNAVVLSMNHVSFAYQGSKEEALSDIDFQVKKGETIGIIGGTGSGKTTLVNLIPRFYDVTKGEILLNGRNIKEERLEELRTKIGIVPQKAILFHGSILDNMRMSKMDASDKEIKEALETAQALEVVNKKQNGLDEILSEGGKNLSGGQRQRLTIARALVRKPSVLIMDDSASALDYATDAALRTSLAENCQDMTVFLVSQRAVSILHADRILVLDDGKMAGMGTHKELMESCGVYQEIVHSQLSKEEVMRHGKE